MVALVLAGLAYCEEPTPPQPPADELALPSPPLLAFMILAMARWFRVFFS